MSCLAATTIFPSPPDVTDAISADLQRNNFNRTIRGSGRHRTDTFDEKRYEEEDENHKDGRKSPEVKVKPVDGKSKGRATQPGIKGLARNFKVR